MIVTVKNQRELMVPPSVQRKAGIQPGDRLEFKVSSGTITIAPAKPAAYKPTRSEWAAIRKGQAEIARGKTVSLSDFLNAVDSNVRKARAKTNRKVSR